MFQLYIGFAAMSRGGGSTQAILRLGTKRASSFGMRKRRFSTPHPLSRRSELTTGILPAMTPFFYDAAIEQYQFSESHPLKPQRLTLLRALMEAYGLTAHLDWQTPPDIDLHHGDSVPWIFSRDPSVPTVSIHEGGRWLFPGMGEVNELGEGAAEGTSVNIPLGGSGACASVVVSGGGGGGNARCALACGVCGVVGSWEGEEGGVVCGGSPVSGGVERDGARWEGV